MNKQKALKIVNFLLGLSVLNQAVTAVISGILPPGIFLAMHKTGGFLAIILAIIHVHLNWGWVKTNLLPRTLKK